MAFRLEEDLLDLKEPVICFLDMKGLKIRTEEELQFALKRVPDLKLRKEKIIDDEILPPPPPVIKKKTGFNNTPLPGGGGSEKRGDANVAGVYDFENPIPDGMRSIKLRDVAQVEIDWKMLTLDRPKTMLDEEIYSRFVELDRLKLKAMASEAPWVLYGNRPAVTILPVTAPGQKKKKKRKSNKKSKGSFSDSEDDDDDDPIKDDDLQTSGYEEDEENPNPLIGSVFNDKFTYEHYARFVEDKDENDDADLAEETQEAPVKREKPATKGLRRKRSAKKKEATPKEQEVKPPLIPITVNPPSPVPPKNTTSKKKTKSKPGGVKNSADKGTKTGEKKRVKSKASDSGEGGPKVKPKTKNNPTSTNKLEVKETKKASPVDDKKPKSSSKSKKKIK